jgi:hypothetical protein
MTLAMVAAEPHNVSVITVQSSEYDKYNAFLKEALVRCANVTTPYDRESKLPLTPAELEKFCDSAVELGLPVIYIGYFPGISYSGSYAAYSSTEMLNKCEEGR